MQFSLSLDFLNQVFYAFWGGGVLYEFADPELEDLSPGQKLLLRMGGEHRATVKEKLREFRTRIVSE